MTIEIRSVEDGESLDAARSLVRDHLQAHSAHHDAAAIERVVSALPSPYLPPKGGLWVAWEGEYPLGCVALHAFDPAIAELKRMYVRSEARGRGVGRRLAQHAVEFARSLGYARIRLATVPTMLEARRLYESIGFCRIDPYRPIDLGDSWFYELVLIPHPPNMTTNESGEP